MRRLKTDAAISALALFVLLAALVIIDPRVREQAMRLTSPSAVVDAGGRFKDIGTTIAVAARDQSMEHAPMLMFAVIATLLVLFMLRT